MAKIIRTIATVKGMDGEGLKRTAYLDDGTNFEQVWIRDEGWYPPVDDGNGRALRWVAILMSMALVFYILLNLHVMTVKWAMRSCLPLWMC